MLGVHGRHMGEIDERHLILQEELVAHVHDLVQRIDLVLGRGRAGPGGARSPRSRDVRARVLRGASKSGSPRRMKTVLVCAVQAPFIMGGAEILVSELRPNLERRGFRVDVANVPFKWYPVSEIVRQALAWRLLDVTESNGTPVDLVIPTKFPSYLVRHPRKVAWLFHQHREAYDLYGTEYCSFTDAPEDQQVREAIHSHGRRGARASAARSSRSRATWPTACARYNGLPGRRSTRRPSTWAATATTSYGDYLFYAGRLDRLKRLDLAIDAMRRVRSGARLKIAGRGPLEDELRKQIEGLGVEDRVELLGFVSADDLLDLYARCRAAYYAPLNEDYGYVTVEAFLSRKPVLTTTDARRAARVRERRGDGPGGRPRAGGPGRTPSTALWQSPERAPARDGRGRATRACADITWDHVIDRLTESLR